MRASLATCVPALSTFAPFTRICPASTRACARSRDGASPCATSSKSSRSFPGFVFLLFVTLLDGRSDIFIAKSRPARDQKFADLAQPRAPLAVEVELPERLRCQVSRNGARFLQPIERRVGSLLLRLIFPRCLPERSRRLLHIKEVIHHLKRPSDIFAKADEARDIRLFCAARQRARNH